MKKLVKNNKCYLNLHPSPFNIPSFTLHPSTFNLFYQFVGKGCHCFGDFALEGGFDGDNGIENLDVFR